MHDVIGINLNMTLSYLNEMHDVIGINLNYDIIVS